MSMSMDDGDGGRQRQPAQQQQACSKCGIAATALPILDTRNGKAFRLFRCDPFQSLSWLKDYLPTK